MRRVLRSEFYHRHRGAIGYALGVVGVAVALLGTYDHAQQLAAQSRLLAAQSKRLAVDERRASREAIHRACLVDARQSKALRILVIHATPTRPLARGADGRRLHYTRKQVRQILAFRRYLISTLPPPPSCDQGGRA